jgi:hypothetical protein
VVGTENRSDFFTWLPREPGAAGALKTAGGVARRPPQGCFLVDLQSDACKQQYEQ